MGRRAVVALQRAGIDRVVVVGGTNDFDVELIPDDEPGRGPLAALLTAYRHTGSGDLIVLPCDLPLVDESAVVAVAEAAMTMIERDVIVGVIMGRPAWPIAYWCRSAEAPLRAAYGSGQRSFVTATDALRVAHVELGEAIADADEPGDLPRTDTLAHGDHPDHGGER
jgi:molybdopterin-guanine dinucleotide biosynthesis protein A